MDPFLAKLGLTATFVTAALGAPLTAQEASWQFATDPAAILGSADAISDQTSLFALRCAASDKPVFGAADIDSVLATKVPNGAIGLLLAPGLLKAFDFADDTGIDLIFVVDGKELFSAPFKIETPEQAYFSTLPGDHVLLAALQSGSSLLLTAAGKDTSVSLSLRGSNASISQLLAFCGLGPASATPQTSPEASSDLSKSGRLPVDNTGSFLRIGGRVMASASTSLNTAFEGLNLKSSMQKLVRDYALQEDTAYLKSDEAAMNQLFASDPTLIEQVLEEARGRPLDRSEKVALETMGGEARYGYISLSPFEMKRAVEGLRQRAGQLVRTDLPPQPIPLRVYCTIRLAPYDFDERAFPLTQTGCNDEIQGLPRPQTGLADWPRLPTAVPYPPERAEQLSALIRGTYWLTVSYETDLTVNVRQSETSSIISTALSPRRNILLHAPDSMTEVLLRIDKESTTPQVQANQPASSATTTSQSVAGIQATPAAALNAPRIDVKDPQSRAKLLELAGPPRALPLTAQEPFPGLNSIRGIIEPEFPFRVQVASAAENDGKLFFAYGGEEFLPDLANALGVPRENLINLTLVNENEPIIGVIGLLPEAAQIYGRTAPADGYGRRVIGYSATVAVTDLRAFATPYGKPILILSLLPLESRFFDVADSRDYTDTLETFSLWREPTTTARDLLEVPNRTAIVLRALDDQSIDPTQTLLKLLNWPEQQQISAFDKALLIEDLITRTRSIPAQPTPLWASGNVTYGDYNFATGRFPARNVTLETLEGYRSPDLSKDAIRFKLDPKVFDLALDRTKAQAWASAHPGKTFEMRARLDVNQTLIENGRVSLSATVSEADLLAKTATARLRDPAHILHRFDLAVMANPEPVAPAAPSPVVVLPPSPARETMGVKLGQSLETAVAQLQTMLINADILQTTAALRAATQPQTEWKSYSTGTLVYDEQQKLAVALFTEPPTSGDTITTIVRSQAFAAGEGPHPETVIAQLVAKYGEPQSDYDAKGSKMIWVESKDANGKMSAGTDQSVASCHRQLSAGYAQQLVLINAERRRLESDAFQSTQAKWFTEMEEPWSPKDMLVHNADSILRPLSTCAALGEIMYALFDLGDDGLLRELHLVISNPADVGRLEVENQKVIQDRDGAKPQAEIKL